MRNSKVLISQALNTIRGNLERTGDPLGLKNAYWTRWAGGLGLPARGAALLYTARMYQMLPYVVQTTEMAAAAQPLLPMLSVKAFAKMAEMAGAIAADPIIRLGARREGDVRERSESALKGIVAALKRAGTPPAYLHENELYSGVLLYDLGLEEAVVPIAREVYRTLNASGSQTVVTVDPHTTFMLRKIYPRYIPGFNLNVRHYLEVLAQTETIFPAIRPDGIPERIVLHDSCVMTRDLGVVEPARTVLSRMGVEVVEPENNRVNTACCGGPVEYAYADLSRSISCIRARELAGRCRDVLVACPICLINLMKHEKDLSIRVWDMGELLHRCFAAPSSKW
ncbi:cysteine-rich domain protein [Desulfosarcina alkanivorans]|uniref:Cysteine-rich domain protein n=1 Tax=Desulfosarcina alkanivorans TaxID=571177 RepID=A0A5K7YFZ2_9BACT|nr:(Fe-S)-binding protein [Desulfosarcina alkanivorans]BBO68472.1 cysteine-rich domain protein [Desulfosarcina alkanivorans]